MHFVVRRLGSFFPSLRHSGVSQFRLTRTEAGQTRRRNKLPSLPFKKKEEKSEWWIVDGEMHEIGDHVLPRERFTIPRDNIPNKRRKQLREQFMRRTRLVLKESQHEPWCKKYMELYNELRENWERLYWDERYSKKIAKILIHTGTGGLTAIKQRSKGLIELHKVITGRKSIRSDKFEYDRERRMRDKAFAVCTNECSTGL